MGMRVEILGAGVDALTMEEAVERVANFVAAGGVHRVMTLNPELLYRAQFDRRLLEIIRRADLVTADGVGIVWAAAVAKRPVPERVTGIDLLLRLADKAAALGWRVFLLGAAPGVAEEAARVLCRRYPGLVIAGTHHGYFPERDSPAVAEAVRRARTDLLFVALGAPRQELWLEEYLQAAGAAVGMGVGGSFDVLAGRARRAPAWVRRLCLEWLYRLVREPSRWRRQLVLPLFAWLVVRRYVLKI